MIRNRAPGKFQERKDMALAAGKIYGSEDITFLDLPNLRMDKEYLLELTKHIEDCIAAVDPDIVHTHFSSDTNVDHGVTHHACVVPAACTGQKSCFAQTV